MAIVEEWGKFVSGVEVEQKKTQEAISMPKQFKQKIIMMDDISDS
jgi:hypothetical protein